MSHVNSNATALAKKRLLEVYIFPLLVNKKFLYWCVKHVLLPPEVTF